MTWVKVVPEITPQELREWSAGLMGYTDYFVAPNGSSYCRDKNGNWITWDPLTDLNQTFMVVDRMRELGGISN